MARRTLKTAVALIVAGAVTFGFTSAASAAVSVPTKAPAISASANQTFDMGGQAVQLRVVNGTVQVARIGDELDGGKSCISAYLATKILLASPATSKKVIEGAMTLAAALGKDNIEVFGYKFTLEGAITLLVALSEENDAKRASTVGDLIADFLC